MAYWLVSHPFQGLYHDAVIYAAMAVHWLDPTSYARDLFFLFGSQDGFSVFSPIFGTLISWFGLVTASQLVVLSGALLSICAALWMARHILPTAAAVGVACVFLLSASSFNYSPNGSTFVLNEGFATARSLAQPLAMLSLAFGISRHMGLALGLAVLATLLHPLIGVWSCLIWWVVYATQRQFWISVGVVGLMASLAIYSGRFEALGLMSSDWFDVVYGLNDVLPKPAQGYRLNQSLFWIAALCIGASWGGNLSRGWYRAAALVTSWGVLAAVLATIYPVVLLVQAQLWRVLWVAYVLGVFALAEVAVLALQRSSRNILWIVLGSCFLWSLDGYSGWLLLGLAALVHIPICCQSAEALGHYLWNSRRLLIAILGLAVLSLLPGYWLALQTAGGGIYAPWWENSDVIKGVVLAGGGGLFFLFIGCLFAIDSARRLLLLILVPFFFVAASHWDARHPAAKEQEGELLKPGLETLSRSVRQGDVVLWPGKVIPIWFILRTASYASAEQTTGVVFSYEKLRESRRRQQRLALASNGDEAQPTKHVADFSFDHFGLDGVRYLCGDTELDWIVVKDTDSFQNLQTGPKFTMGSIRYLALPCKEIR